MHHVDGVAASVSHVRSSRTVRYMMLTRSIVWQRTVQRKVIARSNYYTGTVHVRYGICPLFNSRPTYLSVNTIWIFSSCQRKKKMCINIWLNYYVRFMSRATHLIYIFKCAYMRVSKTGLCWSGHLSPDFRLKLGIQTSSAWTEYLRRFRSFSSAQPELNNGLKSQALKSLIKSPNWVWI